MHTAIKHQESSSKAKSNTFFSPNTLQPKLTIGQPNDKYEQEADAMADKVMRMPQNDIQRACAGCEEDNKVQPKRKSNFLSLKRMIQKMGNGKKNKTLQTKPLMMKSENGGGVATSALTSQLNSSKGGGSPLPSSTNSFMSNAFGSDFSNVRVHTDRKAIQMNQGLNARAFTHGSDVYFNKGEYSPSSSEGRRLLGHELTHVVQQGESTNNSLQTSDNIVQMTPAPPVYGGVTGVRDLSKIRIDAIPDFLATSIISDKNINVHINDARVAHVTWELFNPNDVSQPGSFSTLPNNPNATNKPFTLKPSHFSGTGFIEGKYILRCSGLDSRHRPIVYADRDFNVLSSDLTTGTALSTTYGELTYSKYSKTNATSASSRYSVDVEIKFLPKSNVTCNEVNFIQSMRTIKMDGTSQQNTVNSEQDARKTPLAWSVDRVAGAPSPFYTKGRDASGNIIDIPGWGNSGRGGNSPAEAKLIDQPSWDRENVAQFETCAICRTGANEGQVYGCTTWGYEADAAGIVTLMPRGFQQMPSDQFEEARNAWNTWRVGRPAATRPEEAPTLTSP